MPSNERTLRELAAESGLPDGLELEQLRSLLLLRWCERNARVAQFQAEHDVLYKFRIPHLEQEVSAQTTRAEHAEREVRVAIALAVVVAIVICLCVNANRLG
jgi:hypothetical protein